MFKEISGYANKQMFTLIELLVVIAIIGILAAMLLPALAQAKSQALTVACLGQQKQLAMGVIMYANDNRGYCPPSMSTVPIVEPPWAGWYFEVASTPNLSVTNGYAGYGYLARDGYISGQASFYCANKGFWGSRLDYLHGANSATKARWANMGTSSVAATLMYRGGASGQDKNNGGVPSKYKTMTLKLEKNLELMRVLGQDVYGYNYNGWTGLQYTNPHNGANNLLFYDGHGKTVRDVSGQILLINKYPNVPNAFWAWEKLVREGKL